MATRQEPAAALVSPEQPAAPQTGRVGPPWKTAVLNRLERLRSEPIDPDRTRWVVGIEAEPSEKPVFVLDRFNELLASAENQVARVGVWRELVTFFTGDRIERAWSDLHAADELLVL